jgi:YfiH family protein
MEQVHGTDVVTTLDPDAGRWTGSRRPSVNAVFAGSGDGLVSDAPSRSVSVLTADCASIALGSGEGVFAAVHAGWRGLMGGVVETTVAAMRTMGATDVIGALGPCIHPSCYEFSEGDLARVVAVYGDDVRGRTPAGRPALDLPAAVSAALAASGAGETTGVDVCTACASGYFSHRARGDRGRQALIVWSAEPPGPG